MSPTLKTRERVRQIVITGNPNSGKTTLFNALTGLRQKVGNYPGVTVERKEGHLSFDDGSEAILIDLPGTYSLTPNSPDEKVTTDILLGKLKDGSLPDLVICILDASNIERHLYLATQIIDSQIPVVLALNMIDTAEAAGVKIDTTRLERSLGVRVVPTVGTKGIGITELKHAIAEKHPRRLPSRSLNLPKVVEEELDELIGLLKQYRGTTPPAALHEAVDLLSSNNGHSTELGPLSQEILDHVRKDRERLDFLEIDRPSVFVESRYAWIKRICRDAVTRSSEGGISFSDKLDRILVHRVWGYVIFLTLMGVMFLSVFSWSAIPMEWIGGGFDWIARQVTHLMPPGDLRDLIVNGALAGVSAVVTFLPQILFLFFFLGLLEDTGYMARAAFIMDRVMGKVGLHGKSFIPLLGSFACAIPGIMATRTIDNQKDRLVTMLVAPLMSCSARLPVYTVLIAAFVPGIALFGFLPLPGIVLFTLYLSGLVSALGMAWLFRRTLLKGESSGFIMELPPYRRPSLKSILLQMWDRSALFLKQAGTFILGVSIVLWFLASYPRQEGNSPAVQLERSFAGMAGHLIEPVIKPLGFDWKIGIGLVASVLQREVFVSTMGTIYNIRDAEHTDGTVSLRQRLRESRDGVSGRPSFTLLTAICLMVYYMFAMQCLSTVAVMRRETNGWKWPLIQIGYMTSLAYVATFVVYRTGLFFGLGG